MTSFLTTIAVFLFKLVCTVSMALLWLVLAALGVTAMFFSILFFPFMGKRRKYRTVGGEQVEQWRG